MTIIFLFIPDAIPNSCETHGESLLLADSINTTVSLFDISVLIRAC